MAASSEYRVVFSAATYIDPVEGLGPDGQPTTLQVYKVGRQGETITLTDAQAARLLDLGAVKPADEPLSYSEMSTAQLQALADQRGIQVQGSGANGAVLDSDLVSALTVYDQGQGIVSNVVPPAEPSAAITGDYDSHSVEELQVEADRRGLTVEGTGANGNVVKGDLVSALEADDAK
jgi:hypothetical protein